MEILCCTKILGFALLKTERTICIKKFKKFIAMCLAAVMAMSVMCVGAFAAEPATSNLQFYETDENGNVIDVIDLVYLEDVAEAYEQAKLQRWASTTYYNLANGAYNISGRSAAVVQCGRHFNANSSGRLYFYGEVTDENATVDIYNINSGRYEGSFTLRDQGDGIYSRSGYIPGLSTSSTQYYSFGLTTEGVSNFSSYYAAISWSAL